MDYAYNNKPYSGPSQSSEGSGFFSPGANTTTFIKVSNPLMKQEAKSIVHAPSILEGTVTPPVNYSQNQDYAEEDVHAAGKSSFFAGRKQIELQIISSAYVQQHPQQLMHGPVHPAHYPAHQPPHLPHQHLQQHPLPSVPSQVHQPPQHQQVESLTSIQEHHQPLGVGYYDYTNHSETNVSSTAGSRRYNSQSSPLVPLNTVTGEAVTHVLTIPDVAGTSSIPISTASVAETASFSCNECSQSFPTKLKLTKHQKSHGAANSDAAFKCRVCDKIFRSKNTLICHEKVHGENGVDNNFSCAECGKMFASAEKLQVHRRLHTGEKPYECKVCSKHFNHQSNLIVHSRIHEKVKKAIKCDRCSKVLDNEERLAVHMRLHTGEKPYKCSYCDKRFNHKSTVSTHEKAAHIAANSFRCDRCHKTFNQKCQLQYHEKLQEEDTIACTMCDKVFCYKASLKEHVFKAHSPRQKRNPKKDGQSESSAKADNNGQGRNRYKCTVCDRRFYYARALELHMGVHDASLDVNVLYYSCNYCPETFTEDDLLRKHEEDHEANGTTNFIQNMKHQTAEETTKDGFRCPLCFKEFTGQQALREHHKTHLCANPECSKCVAANQAEFDLTISTYDATEDKRETVCNVCHRVLSTFEQYQNHFYYHTARVPFYCYLCREEFNDKRELYIHTKTHLPRVPESYTCKSCGKVFSTKGNFKRHLKSHEAVRAFACDRCYKQYDYKSALETHLKRAHGIEL
ncbi:zinc finger protein 431-like [Anopheles albimanus]|uniref:zinc finger protein 431-like n=1 Tax=Anopheles albimanus TaxID=7167 RepID=UPI0016402B5E|nr:zinc finger protein 431-like [Anopheles albimanus]